MAKFKVVTPAGISFGNPGTVGYEYEMEALAPIGAEIVEVPSDHGPFGAKGVGEPPVVGVPAAVANAVADATGARLTDLPITSEAIRAALTPRPR